MRPVVTLLKIALFFGLLATGTTAWAGVFDIPDDAGVVAIAVPDDWKPIATVHDNLVAAASPDGTLQLRFVVVDDAKARAFQTSLMAGDPVRGLVPNAASEDRDTVRIAARTATDLTYRTSGSGRMRLIRMSVIPGKTLFITLIGPDEAFDINEKIIDKMLDDVKSLDN